MLALGWVSEEAGQEFREHRRAKNRLRMAGAGEFLPSLEALPIGTAVMGSAALTHPTGQLRAVPAPGINL
jgi:hypothetical protein